LLNSLLENAPDLFDGDEAAERIVVEYVSG
jgi:hypothetical protein